MTAAPRTALVTGGGAGIGKATCLRLAREGRSVGVLGIDPENISAVVKTIEDGGGKAIAVPADVSDRAQVAAAIAKVRHTFGPITILINNAGVEDCASAKPMRLRPLAASSPRTTPAISLDSCSGSTVVLRSNRT